MNKKKVDLGSWGTPKRVKQYELARREDPFNPKVHTSRPKQDPRICHKTKKEHNYTEIDRWQWSQLFKNDTQPDKDTIHISEQCQDCGKKRHRHENP